MKKTLLIVAIVGVLGIATTAGILTKSKSSSKKNHSIETVFDEENSAQEEYEIPRYSVKRTDSQVIQHKAYTVDYNEEWRLPNWVAYSLTSSQTKGPVERYNKFMPDPYVKGASAQYWDYRSSKYDRGHMVPAGDMKWDRTAMEECFYLSNICPQNHTMNEGDWNYLENRVRGWANFFGEVYVVCGPIVAEHPEVIGENCIAVPDSFYKVVLCNMRGEWNAIGFVMPNTAQQQPISSYCRTIDFVENITGIDFFHKLPDDVENRIEASYDKDKWRIR